MRNLKLVMVAYLLLMVSCHSLTPYTKVYGDDGFWVGDYYRAWEECVPADLPENVPLVIDIHGWRSTATEQRMISGFKDLAESEKFIVVWPYGIGRSWNSGKPCCEPALSLEIDDVGFIRQMVGVLVKKYSIDPSRIYLTGLSNGSAMSQRLAAEASDLFAAVACMSFYLFVEPAEDYSPVPIMLLHGTSDSVVAYDNGDGEHEDPKLGRSAPANFQKWKEINGCVGEEVETWRLNGSYAMSAKNPAGVEVTLVSIDKGGHVLYKGWGTSVDTTRLAWDFLKRF